MEKQYFAPQYIEVNVKHGNTAHIVGSYSKTYLIRVGKTRFVPFAHELTIMDPYDIKALQDFVDSHKTNGNIVIEDDARILITYLIDMLGDNFLIYSEVKKRCLTIFEHAAMVFEMQPYTLNLYQIGQMFKANILITQSFKNSNLTWNAKIMLDTIINCKYSLFFIVMKQYFERIVNKSIYNINSVLSKELTTYLKKLYKYQVIPDKFEVFKLEQVTNNDLCNVIRYLADVSS